MRGLTEGICICSASETQSCEVEEEKDSRRLFPLVQTFLHRTQASQNPLLGPNRVKRGESPLFSPIKKKSLPL